MGDPWRPGLDGPIPQRPNGTAATPFALTAGDTRTMEAIASLSEPAADPSEMVTRVPGPGRRMGRSHMWSDPAAADRPSSASRLTPQTLEPPSAVSVTLGTTLEGPDKTAVPYFPPDTMGDAGPTQYFFTINGRMVITRKSTGVQEYNLSPDAFFPSSIRGGAETGDPRVRFDRQAQRWWVTYFTTSLPNRIVIAFSNTATITDTTTWTYLSIANTVTRGSDPCFADYPTLGLDTHALYIGVNQFCGSGYEFYTSSGFVLHKATSLSGGTASVTLFSPLMNLTTYAGIYTPQGVDNYDANPAFGFFVGADGERYDRLNVVRIASPGTTTPSASAFPITVDAATAPPNVPVPGMPWPLDAIDHRLMNGVIRSGRLYTAQAIGVRQNGTTSGAGSLRAGVRWYQLDGLGTTPIVGQFGTIWDSAVSSPVHHWLPSVNINAAGTLVVGYSVGGALLSPGARVSYRLMTDPQGELRAPTTIVSGASAAYNPYTPFYGYHRWGDYSMTSVDPTDDTTFWTAQSYLKADHVYGTRAVQVSTPVPPVVEVSPVSWSPASMGGAQLFSVTDSSGGVSWTVSTSAPWLTVEGGASTGVGSGSFTLRAAATTSALARSATAQVTAGGAATLISVTQAAGVNTFTVTPTTWNAPSSGGSRTVSVAATMGDAPWTASATAQPSWLAVSPTAGSGSGTVTLTAEASRSIATRSTTATIAGQLVQVTQPGTTNVFTLSASTWDVASDGARLSMTIDATTDDAPWSVTNLPAWITATPGSGIGRGTTTLAASANPSITGRSATVSIAGLALTATQGGGTPSFVVAPASVSLPAAGGTAVLTIDASLNDAPWSLTGLPSWLTASITTGVGDSAVMIRAGSTTSVAARTATFTVGGQSVAVTQAAGTPVFTTPVSEWTADANGATLAVPLSSNLMDAPWSTTFSASWLSWDRTSGLGPLVSPLRLTAAANLGPARTATATVAGLRITVTQPSGVRAPSGLRVAALSADSVTFEWDWTGGERTTGFVLAGGIEPGQTLAQIPVPGLTRRITIAPPPGRYFVRVHAVEDTEFRSPSNEIPVVVGVPAPPTTPLFLLATVAGTNLDLAWTNTLEGGPATGMLLHVSGSINAVLPLPFTDHFSYSGVPPGTYTLRMQAINAHGVSDLSAPVTFTSPGVACSGVPEPPARISYVVDGTYVSLRWNSAATGAAPTSFILQIRGLLNYDAPVGALRSIEGTVPLPPGYYEVSIVAVNACGRSAPSPPVGAVIGGR